MKSKFSILIIILLVAGFLRFNQLNRVPPSLSLDEVSIGWNAYSILKTGKDEYGNRLPVLLRAYDDWRPALYVYLVVPFVKFFGLSVAAVRLPAVLLSLVTILTTYFLAKELFPKRTINYQLSTISIFLLAISPWHIYISRLGHEVNAGLTFTLLAIFFFLKWFHSKTLVYRTRVTWLILATFFFALSFYTYQSQKVFIPLMILTLGLIFRKRLSEMKRDVILAGLLGLILVVPIFKASLSSEALVRFRATSIFANQPEIQQVSSLRVARDYQNNHFFGLIFDNRQVAMSLAVLRAYFSHFNPSWLFFNSGEEDHKVPGMGILYLWELPLLLVGGYQLTRSKFPKKSKLLLFSWLLIAPLSASIATDAPHAMRTFNMLPVPSILTAMGIRVIISKLKLLNQNYLKFLIFSLCSLFFIFNILYLYHNYFVNFPLEQSESFQYPLAQAINYTLDGESKYERIVFSNKDNCYQSYMFFLFFSRYDPALYLAQGGTISGGFAETHAFGKYEFRPIDWGKEEKDKTILYVGNINDFPSSVKPLQIFKLLNNQEAIKIVRGG